MCFAGGHFSHGHLRACFFVLGGFIFFCITNAEFVLAFFLHLFLPFLYISLLSAFDHTSGILIDQVKCINAMDVMHFMD